MAITKLTQMAETSSYDNSATIKFTCPICKTKKGLNFPKSVITQAKGLTTMSIAKGLVCEHQFQAFVDRSFAVRGYQRVDFEFNPVKNEGKEPSPQKDDKELFENLILEGNYLEYKPKHECVKQDKPKKKKKQLKEIYKEFWEFIDEDNELFQDFIKNDERRKKLMP
ncbi:MAG: hypothetical protein ACW986_07580 [Promethearchaeota archaeon]|jgi:hypothetical protein